MYIMLQKNLKAITWSTAERVRFHCYERSLKHLKQSPQWPSIYIIQEEAYFPIREINLSQQKNPSDGTDFGLLFHTSNIVSLRLGPYFKGECMN